MSDQGPFNHIGTREVDEAFHRLTVAQRDAARFSLACLRAEVATLEEKVRAALEREAVRWGQLGLVMEAMVEAATTHDHACIAAMREQLAQRDARIAVLEEAVRHILDDIRPTLSPGSVSIGNHRIAELKNAMYVGHGPPPCERGQG